MEPILCSLVQKHLMLHADVMVDHKLNPFTLALLDALMDFMASMWIHEQKQ